MYQAKSRGPNNFQLYSEGTSALGRAIIALAHSLNMKGIAEQAETASQHDFLLKCHCDELQGYYLGRPTQPIGFLQYFSAQTT